MRTADFEYQLPKELIAQAPAGQRDASRLLVMDRAKHSMEHMRFQDLPFLLRPGDLLVYNNSRVIPARLYGAKTTTGTRLELLLLEENQTNDWWIMLRPGKRAPKGTCIQLFNNSGIRTNVFAKVIDKNVSGYYRVQFECSENILQQLESLGFVPLPPYIERPAQSSFAFDRERYQTVYAQSPGSIAAPTAGLHFTSQSLEVLRNNGISMCSLTLHVGVGTFAPVKAEQITDHQMHEERFELPGSTVETIETARREHRRVIAVGTTTVRVLESVARANEGRLVPGAGRTRIFIYPPSHFQIVDGLVTNFHLPQSTLLMLVCAFASPGAVSGRDWMIEAYAEAVRQRYRFFSYGDAMLVV